jgi:FtsH-binding integral membrane protein
LVSISEKGETKVVPYLIFGLISVVAGMSIFYLLPLAVLNFDIGLILQIFFMILLGMIFGLTLISFNLQRLLEILIVKTLLFYERQSMKLMIRKNLIAHRESNKLTSIIYSLTLGCIIFVVVAANLQVAELT